MQQGRIWHLGKIEFSADFETLGKNTFNSCVNNFVLVTILLTKSISIHSDYQGVHFS